MLAALPFSLNFVHPLMMWMLPGRWRLRHVPWDQGKKSAHRYPEQRKALIPASLPSVTISGAVLCWR